MQDGVFEPGELNIAAELIKRWIGFYGISKIYVVDAHFAGKEWVNNRSVKCLSALYLLKEAACAKYQDILFISPDAGSSRRTGLPGFLKERKDSRRVEIIPDAGLATKINGRVVGVVDDLIETGGTLARVYELCKDLGAVKVIALATHGVLPSGVERLKNIYDDLFLTNSINCQDAKIDVSGLIGQALVES